MAFYGKRKLKRRRADKISFLTDPRFIMFNKKAQLERLDYWNNFFHKYETADPDSDDESILIPVVTKHKKSRKAGATFKVRCADRARKKRKMAKQRLPCKGDELENVSKQGKKNVNSRAVLKTKVNNDVDCRSNGKRKINKPKPFCLFTIQRVGHRKRSKQIKKEPSSSNGQRLVVNVFSKNFNRGSKRIKNEPSSSNGQRLVANVFSKEFSTGSKQIKKELNSSNGQRLVANVVSKKLNTHSKQIKKEPSSSNGQRLVANVFSKEFSTGSKQIKKELNSSNNQSLVDNASKKLNARSKQIKREPSNSNNQSLSKKLNTPSKQIKKELNSSNNQSLMDNVLLKKLNTRSKQIKKNPSSSNNQSLVVNGFSKEFSTGSNQIKKELSSSNGQNLVDNVLSKKLNTRSKQVKKELSSSNSQSFVDNVLLKKLNTRSKQIKKVRNSSNNQSRVVNVFSKEFSTGSKQIKKELRSSNSVNLVDNVVSKELNTRSKQIKEPSSSNSQVVNVLSKKKNTRSKQIKKEPSNSNSQVDNVVSKELNTRSKQIKKEPSNSNSQVDNVVSKELNTRSKQIKEPSSSNSQVDNVLSKKKNTRSKQIKKEPSSSNRKSVVVNVFSNEFNTLLATKYKHCLAKLDSSEDDVEGLCKKLHNDLNANAVAPENSSPNRSQSASSSTSNRKSPKKELPAINESDHDINIELDSENTKTSIDRCDEPLDKVKSKKVRLDDANLSQRRRLPRTCKNKNESKSKQQQFKSEHSSLTTLKLRKALYEDLDRKLKSELNDAESARMCTQSKTAHETSVKVEPTAELVLHNKTVRPIRQNRQPKKHCPVCVNCTSETTSHGAASKNTSPANNRNDSSNKTKLETTYKRRNNRNRKQATHDNTVPAVNAKLENESFKTQSLTDTSANARWCLRNRTVFESSEMSEELEAKLLIEEKLKSDLGNMVFERFCCLNRPDRDANLLEYWNEQVKKELQRLSKIVSLKQLALYMKLALAERLSSTSSFNNGGKS